MKFNALLFLVLICFLTACNNEPTAEQAKALPQSQSKIAWKQDGKAHTTQTVTATLNDDNTIMVITQSIAAEKLTFNEIPYRVGVHPIGKDLTDLNDELVGATFSIDQEGKKCNYIAVPDAEKENNHFAITYVDTSRGIVSGKFKMKVKKQDTSSCGSEQADEIAFAEGEFAIKLQ